MPKRNSSTGLVSLNSLETTERATALLMRRADGWSWLSVVLLLVAVTLVPPAVAQQDFSNVTMQSKKVSGKVHMLIGAGGNIGVSAGSDGLLIVDDQFAPLAGKIREALAQIGTGELEFVLNTHFHGDHTGSNAEFGKEALIVAHANVRKRLSTPQTSPRGTTPAQPESAWPVVTFEDALSIHFNGEEIRVWHLPSGHTDGDSVVHFVDSNVLHMGDHFFVDRFPFVDLSSGGNAVGFAENVGEVLANLPAGVQIIPGHGPLATADDLERFHGMLVATIDHVRTAKDAGRSLEQIKEAGFGDEWDGWGAGFINDQFWAEIVFNSL